MLVINEKPRIEEVVSVEDGYHARTLCMVDGHAAEIDIRVDTHRQKYSRFEVRYFDFIKAVWVELYSLTPGEVGRMPVLHDEPETLERLNQAADVLWKCASTILRISRQRSEVLETDEYVRNRMALQEEQYARAARRVQALTPEESWYPEGATQSDFVLAGAPDHDPFASGEHDEAREAADAPEEVAQG